LKRVVKIILCICIPIALVVASCNIYSNYQSYKLLEDRKQRALPEARVFIEETAHLFDIIRYGEYTKHNMQMIYEKDNSEYANTDGWSPYISFKINAEEYSIPLHSDELNKYLSQEEIDTIIYLTELNGNRNCSNIYSEGMDKISTAVGINGVIVYITSEPYDLSSDLSYIEQVGDYFIQVVTFRERH